LSVALNRSAQVGISFDPEILAEYQLAEVDLSDWFKADELDEMFAGIGESDLEIPKRPDFDNVIEELNKGNVGASKKDQNWFYVEYYGDDDRFETVKSRLKLTSEHQIDADFFYSMLNGETDEI
jgi:hypothetical protein